MASINPKAPILITGGAGFLGSHMVALCLEKSSDVIVIDNLSNSDLGNLKTLEKYFNRKIPFFKLDLRDQVGLKNFFNSNQCSSIIHFAGLKSVSESREKPELYYQNNVVGSENLIANIKEQGINKVIFSSSATVYGEPKYLPIDEEHPINPINPYGETKAKVEKLFLEDSYFKSASVKLLRYFNPAGSFKGIIGEKLNGIPNNLMPYILGVARGEYEHLNIYGDDFETVDGTGVRDYVHVMDLVTAHWTVLSDKTLGCEIFNIGFGKGFSVKQVVETFVEMNSVSIPFQIQPRRAGDSAISYAAVDKIKKKFNWSAKLTLKDICRDVWSVNS